MLYIEKFLENLELDETLELTTIFYVIHQWTEISFWLKDLKGKTVEI